MLDLSIKKDSKNKVQNYHPMSILSNLCKAYEKCLFNETTTHFDSILSKYQRGLEKDSALTNVYLCLLTNGKNREKGGSFVAILTDLSKAFDCILHDLIISELPAYSFDMASLKLIYTYLSGRKQKVKINDK